MKKYEFTDEKKLVGNHTLHRIRAVRDFGVVKAGDLGGWIEDEDNLSHDGYAWVYDEALVEGNAFVTGNACVTGDALVTGNAQVKDNTDFSIIGGFGRIFRTTTFFAAKTEKSARNAAAFTAI